MGTWGTAISSNDTYADIYGSFFDLYNDGLEVAEITKKIIANNQDTISDFGDSNNLWFALAKAQWGNVPFAAIFQSKQKTHRKTSDYKILFLQNERYFRSFFYLCILKIA